MPEPGAAGPDAAAVDGADARARLVAVVGATGTGKSDLAIALARELERRGTPAAIVNADAMQLYRGMDIGTAKVPEPDRQGIPHHLLDVLEVTEAASVAAYQEAARAAVAAIQSRGGTAILVGGSGLYVSSVLFGMEFPGRDAALRAEFERLLDRDGPGAVLARLRALDPEAAALVDPRNGRRLVRALEVATRADVVRPALPSDPVAWRPSTVLHLRRDRDVLVPALHARAARMFADGLVDEVSGLVDRGLEQGTTARVAIGYAQALDVLHGAASESDAIERTAVLTRQYARRQVSWFKRYTTGRQTRVEDVDVTGADAQELVRRASTLADRITG